MDSGITGANAANSSSRVIPIEDINDPRVAKFALRRDVQLRPFEEMVVDSEKVVQRAIKRGIVMRAVLATESHYKRNWDLLSRLPNCELFQASTQMMQQIVGHRIHQGIMALADRPEQPPLASLSGNLVFMDHITDTQNVGAIIRCCHAFGYGGVILNGNSCSPFVRRSIRVSMGSVFCVPVHHGADRLELAQSLKDRGYLLVAAGRWETSKAIADIELDRPYCLIIGNEDQGVHPDLLAMCDLQVEIDLAPGIDSLNAAVAAGVLLHGLRERQRLALGTRCP